MAGIVDEDVEATEAIHTCLNGGSSRSLAREIDLAYDSGRSSVE
jgi:hypothetical protein